MGPIASQITSLTIVYSTVYQTQITENIKAPRHWPLCGKFTGTGEFPAQMASNAENVSIWWRHHENIQHWKMTNIEQMAIWKTSTYYLIIVYIKSYIFILYFS